ncbi:MAG: LAGLIDADG family homing endonuclease [Patescibacteria group bacterium]
MAFYFTTPNLLPKTDKKYKKWLKSLKKRPPSWSKGYTKLDHPSVAKISETFKNKKIDNFKAWRLQMVKKGKFHSYPKKLKRTKELAELMGVILGDGNIYKFSRTEGLTIVSNAKNIGFVNRYAGIIYGVFSKKSAISKPAKGCIRIKIYQKYLSARIGIPCGNRGNLKIEIPNWILKSKKNIISYLRGLYEAEGSFCVHKPTYTYKFLFSNKNESLLNNVYVCLKILGFHPHRSRYQIQISKKTEVYKIKDLIKFRQY